jgi:hypothetical protein
MATTRDYSKSTPQAVYGTKQHWDTFGASIGAPTSVFPVGFAWTDFLNGEKVPNWKRVISEGRDATTNMLAEQQKVTHLDGDQYVKARRKSDGRIYHRRDAGWCDTSMSFPTAPFSTLSSDSAQRDAASKWYSRATTAQTQLMLGVTVGELGETLNLVRKRGASVVQLLTNWRTVARRLRKTKNWKKKLAGLYLEYSFGVRPLLADVSGALSAWKDPRKEIARVSASAETNVDASSASTTTFGTIQYDRNYRTSSKVSVHIRGGVKVEVSGHGRNMQAFGLMPRTWIPTAYELIPWSFFVDYFTDLGNVINALCFPKSDIAWASTTTVRSMSNMVIVSGARLAPLFTSTFDVQEITDHPQVTTLTRKQVSRARGAPKIPTPTVRLPTSVRTWANIAALAISRFAVSDREFARSLRI